jgi:hypothetical protein
MKLGCWRGATQLSLSSLTRRRGPRGGGSGGTATDSARRDRSPGPAGPGPPLVLRLRLRVRLGLAGDAGFSATSLGARAPGPRLPALLLTLRWHWALPVARAGLHCQ